MKSRILVRRLAVVAQCVLSTVVGSQGSAAARADQGGDGGEVSGGSEEEAPLQPAANLRTKIVWISEALTQT